MNSDTVLVECFDRHDRIVIRESFVLADGKRSLTIGRSLLADVTLSDEHAAGMHASVEISMEGSITATDLGSVNGLVVAGRRHYQARDLPLPDQSLQVGRTQIRIRTANETLAPEKPDHLRSEWLRLHPGWVAGFFAFIIVCQEVYDTWLSTPSDLVSNIVYAISAGAVVVALWIAFWALLSRVMLAQWRWSRHAAILLGVGAIYVAVIAILELSVFMLAAPHTKTGEPIIAGIAVAALLYLHLRNASGLAARGAAVIACLLPVLTLGITQWADSRSTARDVNHIDAYLRIYPPSFRLRSADPLDSYVDALSELRSKAQEKRDALPRSENEDTIGLLGF